MTTPAHFDVLGTIVAATRRRVESARAREPLPAVERRAARCAPRADTFLASLTGGGVNGLRVIAECKRRSPSRGVLCEDYDPVAIALSYEAAGAVALSILTEPAFFDGALAHLERVREPRHAAAAAQGLHPRPLSTRGGPGGRGRRGAAHRGRADRRGTGRLRKDAEALGLAVLVEAHDAEQMRRAFAAGASIIGVNNRDLRTLGVDLATSAALAAMIPDPCVAVAESGLRSHDDLRRLRVAGYDAFLIGEHCLTAPDPGAALRVLLTGGRRSGTAS